uniref:B-cell translocation gene 1 protein n=1 Tax=Crotalus adamanteus TaxID=8729 RepID=A0A0F7ZEK4_CROAD
MHPALYTRANMIREIAAAVNFVSKFLRTNGLMNERQLQTFSQSLQELLAGEGGGLRIFVSFRLVAGGGEQATTAQLLF